MPAQEHVAQHRKVVVPRDLVSARRAVRARPDDRAFLGKPDDADVEEAADHRAEDEDRGNHGPIHAAASVAEGGASRAPRASAGNAASSGVESYAKRPA